MSPEFSTDEALLRGCSRGDGHAWDEFIARYSKLIYWAIHQSLGNSRFSQREDLVGDLFQDVFQKLFEKNALADLKETVNLKKFLVVLSAHLTLDRLKSLKRSEDRHVSIDALLPGHGEKEGLTGDLEAPPSEGPREKAQTHEAQAAILEVMGSLGAKERTCVEFHVYDGKTHHEISEILGLSQDAVSAVIKRAKDKIRKKISKKDIF